VKGDGLPYVKWGVQMADFDLDAWPDLMVADGHVDDNLKDFGQDVSYAEPPLFFRNLGGKRFEFLGAAAGPYFARPHVGRGLVTADLDNDGALDAAIGHQDDLPAVLRNTVFERRPEAASVSLKLVGRVSNRDAVGASLRGRSRLGTLTQQVKGGRSYNSAPDLRQVFAVHRGETGIAVAIRWPRGTASEIAGLEAGRHYVVIEPQVPADPPAVVPWGVFP
jgi:hypothetical protein